MFLIWYRGSAVVVLAIALTRIGTWVISPGPWAAPNHFRLLGVTYRVTNIRVGSVGPPFNWSASAPAPAVVRDPWAISGHRTYQMLAFRTKWGYVQAVAQTPPRGPPRSRRRTRSVRDLAPPWTSCDSRAECGSRCLPGG